MIKERGRGRACSVPGKGAECTSPARRKQVHVFAGGVGYGGEKEP